MSTVNTAQPAFPITYEWLNKSDANAFAPDGSVVPPWQSTRITQHGMGLRDYFAAKVIGHLVASEARQECTVEDDVRLAFKYADAMLAARTTGARDE